MRRSHGESVKYTIEFDPETGTIVVTQRGKFDLELSQRAMREVNEIRSSVALAHSIWDVRELVFSTFDVENVKRIGHTRASMPERRPNERMATVLSDPADRSIINLLLAYSQVPASNWRFFDTLEAAIDWCTAEPDEGG